MLSTSRFCCSVQATKMLYKRFIWSKLPLAPPDKILGLNEMFNNDSSLSKVNLGVGAYRDEIGKPKVLPSVKKAKDILSASSTGHEYAGIAGLSEFVEESIKLAYGTNAEVIQSKRVAAVQALSGTGACRLFAEFIAKFYGRGTRVYLPNPTWGNHVAIIKSAGLEPVMYRYFDSKTNSIDFAGWLQDAETADTGSVFLIHACAHNPTGCDPTKEQWLKLSEVMKAKKHVSFFDCAYQGFATGDTEADAHAIRLFVEEGHHIILAQSFAKNFGLYGERIGTLSIVTQNADEAARVKSQLLQLIRPMYSNPPLYGARLVTEILKNPTLKAEWMVDCKAMADRIKEMRSILKTELESLGSKLNWSHITNQIGMFCYSGLTVEQVTRLRVEFHIYCTDDGRISMAGINQSNVKCIAQAIHMCTST